MVIIIKTQKQQLEANKIRKESKSMNRGNLTKALPTSQSNEHCRDYTKIQNKKESRNGRKRKNIQQLKITFTTISGCKLVNKMKEVS